MNKIIKIFFCVQTICCTVYSFASNSGEAKINNHDSFHQFYFNPEVNVNYQDKNGNTPLMVAIQHDCNYQFVKLLQVPHLNLSLQNRNGCTALMGAAALGRTPYVCRILNDPRGLATVNMVNHLDMNIEEIATLTRSLDIADLIRLKNDEIIEAPSMLDYPTHVLPQKVLICGVCKDIADKLPDMIKVIEQVGGLFTDYKVLIYENNSGDGTNRILQNWERTNPKVLVECEYLFQRYLRNEVYNIQPDGTFFKVDLIARARNIILEKVMRKEYDDYPYMIMMDMDFKTPPPPESIIEVFESKQEWDAVFAYGLSRIWQYWDWYAFRDYHQPFGPELIGHDWFAPKSWSRSREDEWYPVYSAFGGLGIYKKASIKGCRYSGLVTKDMETLAKKIIEEGKKTNHPIINKYLKEKEQLKGLVNIFKPSIGLPYIKDEEIGIMLQDTPDALVWRMNSFVYQYPVTCDTVPFHASMIVNGHGKLFINPRMLFYYE